MKTKKFTILHSNDMHGDFLAEIKTGKKELIGGLSLLSGYINKVR
ncbi:MAG: 3'-nucleotidase, partial [Candidatus Pacebacteria bacterium]|nr:3'-nucleotidase [Candidatus Paceibacterota bacterium]